MSIWVQTIIFSLLLVQTVEGSEGSVPVRKAQPEWTDYSVVLVNLPWSFVVKQSEKGLAPGQLRHIRYDFKSRHPVSKTAQGGIYLKAWLEWTQFDNAQTADAAMQRVRATAHPDMGMSYEWDHLILKRDYLYHLHAGCTFSEELFSQMRQNFEQIVGIDENVIGLNCRCGAGCTAFSSVVDQQELNNE